MKQNQRKLRQKTKGNKNQYKFKQKTKENKRKIKRVNFKGAMGNKRGWELRGFMREMIEGKQKGSVRGKQGVKIISRSNKQKIMH